MQNLKRVGIPAWRRHRPRGGGTVQYTRGPAAGPSRAQRKHTASRLSHCREQQGAKLQAQSYSRPWASVSAGPGVRSSRVRCGGWHGGAESKQTRRIRPCPIRVSRQAGKAGQIWYVEAPKPHTHARTPISKARPGMHAFTDVQVQATTCAHSSCQAPVLARRASPTPLARHAAPTLPDWLTGTAGRGKRAQRAALHRRAWAQPGSWTALSGAHTSSRCIMRPAAGGDLAAAAAAEHNWRAAGPLWHSELVAHVPHSREIMATVDEAVPQAPQEPEQPAQVPELGCRDVIVRWTTARVHAGGELSA